VLAQSQALTVENLLGTLSPYNELVDVQLMPYSRFSGVWPHCHPHNRMAEREREEHTHTSTPVSLCLRLCLCVCLMLGALRRRRGGVLGRGVGDAGRA
jgi:hypothetical protein